jgi:NAD+ kinase
MKKIQSIGISLRPKFDQEFKNMITTLYQWLSRRGVEIYYRDSIQIALEKNMPEFCESQKIQFKSLSEFMDLDLVLSLGGDGTLIGSSRELEGGPPIMGINWGRLGFTTEFSAHEMYDSLTEIIKGNFKTTKRKLLCVEIKEKNKTIFKKSFINDVVITKNDIARLFNLRVDCNDEPLLHLAGDGIIVSSPLGSTAYSLAAGGPIVHPSVQAMIIAPICPHSLLHRPIVIDDSSKLKISIPKSQKNVILTLDGQHLIEISSQQTVHVKKSSKKPVTFIVNPHKSYFNTLREKFLNQHKES